MRVRVSLFTRAALVCLAAGFVLGHPDVLVATASNVSSSSDVLGAGESLYPGQSKTSGNGQYSLVYQGDGNLVLYDNGTPVWDSGTAGSSAGQAAMQGDGNFVVYDGGGTPLRASNTDGNSGAWLLVQNDGNVVVYADGGGPLWDRYGANWSGGPPAQNKYVFLVNGSFTSIPAGWSSPGSPMWNAVASTYGISPTQWHWSENSLGEVIAPNYSGIWYGGWRLANDLANLPAGEVNIISHSHGGNVVLASQAWSTRPIRRYIQLATPVNWDFGSYRWAIGWTVSGRCQVSSDADWVQFFGASPGQITNFAIAMYASHAGSQEAYDALNRGDYAEALAWFAAASFAAYLADYWFWTTKDEVEGGNITFYGYGIGHSAMHEPPVWNTVAPYCS